MLAERDKRGTDNNMEISEYEKIKKALNDCREKLKNITVETDDGYDANDIEQNDKYSISAYGIDTEIYALAKINCDGINTDRLWVEAWKPEGYKSRLESILPEDRYTHAMVYIEKFIKEIDKKINCEKDLNNIVNASKRLTNNYYDTHYIQVLCNCNTGRLYYEEYADGNSFLAATPPDMTILNIHSPVAKEELRELINTEFLKKEPTVDDLGRER